LEFQFRCFGCVEKVLFDRKSAVFSDRDDRSIVEGKLDLASLPVVMVSFSSSCWPSFRGTALPDLNRLASPLAADTTPTLAIRAEPERAQKSERMRSRLNIKTPL
jgi:hypothetical protein